MSVELVTEHEGQKIMHNTEFNMTQRSGGVSIQQDDNDNPLVRMDDQGFKLFNTLGTVIAQMTRDGFEYFNNAGVKIASVGANGFEYFNGNGQLIAKVGATGFEYYDANGVKRISTGINDEKGNVRFLFFDENGVPNILVGQDPLDGQPVFAVVPAGTDVEAKLAE